MLIGSAGATIGLLLAYVLLPIVARQPELVPRMSWAVFDGRVLAFAGIASVAEGLGIGLGSAIQATRWKVQHPTLPRVDNAYVSFRDVPLRGMTLLLRSESPPADLAARVRRAVRGVDAGAALSELRSVDERYRDVVALDRFLPRFLAVVAVVAVLLAALGVYGLVSFTVARRGHEIGVRLALGGEPTAIVWMLFRHGARLVTIGVLLGTAAALALARALSALLFETDPTDPLTYVLVGGFLITVVLIATYLPSRRATEVDPMKVLPA